MFDYFKEMKTSAFEKSDEDMAGKPKKDKFLSQYLLYSVFLLRSALYLVSANPAEVQFRILITVLNSVFLTELF
jgi:hypothetical protein